MEYKNVFFRLIRQFPRFAFNFLRLARTIGINFAFRHAGLRIYRALLGKKLFQYSYNYHEKYNIGCFFYSKIFPKKPLISIVIILSDDIDLQLLTAAISSVKKQFYKKWEVCIAVSCNIKSEIIEYLKKESGTNIRIAIFQFDEIKSSIISHILAMTSGEYVGFLEPTDELTRDALYEFVKALNHSNADLIYSDEDQIDIVQKYSMPFFKPDWSPDRLLAQNYIGKFTIYNNKLAKQFTSISNEYDLILQMTEKTERIFHISKVLYHRRQNSNDIKNDIYILQTAINRRRIAADVLCGIIPDTYRIKYKILGNPLVSIVMPFRDKPELLYNCLMSILDKTTYNNFEVIGVSNNSTDPAVFELMDFFKAKDNRINFITYNIPFNFSKLVNYVVKNYARGDHLILLNNDIEIITPDWIESLLEYSQRPDVAVVGAKLYYPNDTIQHAGVVVGDLGIAIHVMRGEQRTSSGYYNNLNVVCNYSAVTGACCMVKRSIYDELCGLDENFQVAFNDIDFCLRARKLGYLNVFTPYCEAYHHEMASRGPDDTPEKRAINEREVEYFIKLHAELLKKGDPYYNKNLVFQREDFKCF